MHGSLADAGDITEFFDYLFLPREKEAVARSAGVGEAESVGGRSGRPVGGAARIDCRARDAKNWLANTGSRYKKKQDMGHGPMSCFLFMGVALRVPSLTFGPAGFDFRHIVAEPLFQDCLARTGHEVLVIGDVDRRQSHHPENLA